jgi:hypothetical protein
MEQKLRVVLQNCLRMVAGDAKALNTARHFTCMKQSITSTIPEVVHINLNSILVDGRGLHWFIPGGFNLITLRLQVAYATLLPSESVKVHFSRPGSEVVNVKSVNGGLLQILYRAVGTDALGLMVTVCDQIVSESIAQLGMSVDTALAEFKKMRRRDAVNIARCGTILSCWPDHAGVVVALLRSFCNLTFRAWHDALSVSVIIDVMIRHDGVSKIQHLGLDYLSMSVINDRVEEVLAVENWDACIYAAMDAFPNDIKVQTYGCTLIWEIADKSVSGKKVLLSGRALDVCQRARHFAPVYVDCVIRVLRLS